MTDFENILSLLKGVKQTGNGYVAFCPAHDDRSNRSLSLTEKEGKLLMHCFCGCSFGQILDALNIPKPSIVPELEAVYDYTDADGNLLYQALRYYPKSFKQRRSDNNDWVWNLQSVQRVLFQLPKVLEAVNRDELIYFVEGEKDCLNLAHRGMTATSISGGASSPWQPQYSEALHRAKVAIIPDDDISGHKHAEKIGSQLYGWATVVKILKLGSEDVTEWLKTHNVDELQSLWDNAKSYQPIGAVTREEFTSLKGHLIYLQGIMELRAERVKRAKPQW